jgi:DNA replication protein DnaC
MYKLDELPVRRRSWVQIASIPRARLGWTLEDCSEAPEEVVERLRAWIGAVGKGKVIKANGTPGCGKGILLYGAPGHGKTTLAVVAIQEMLRTFEPSAFSPSEGKVLVRPCYFSTFNTILDLKGELMNSPTSEQETLYEGMLGECKDDAYNIRVLVIDDVGKEHASLSGWQRNMLHHVLRTRFNNGLPTIVTTNIALEKWGATYGDATESFALEAFSYLPVKSETGDLRRSKGN